MKTFAPAFLAAFVASVLTAGGFTLLREDVAPSDESTKASSPAAPAGSGEVAAAQPLAAARDNESRARIEELELRLAALEGRLAASEGRKPVGEPEVAMAAVPVEDEVLRAIVLDQIEAKEDADRAAREERRAEQMEERLLARADTIAQELGLATRDRDAVYGVLLEENQRRTAIFEDMRENGGWGPDSRDVMRAEMETIQTWKSEELNQRLGSQLGGQVIAYEEENSDRRGGGFGRDRRGGGGGGGRGGGGN